MVKKYNSKRKIPAFKDFNLLEYPIEFLKTTIGKTCVFNQIIPYLYSADDEDKRLRLSVFMSILNRAYIEKEIRKKIKNDKKITKTRFDLILYLKENGKRQDDFILNAYEKELSILLTIKKIRKAKSLSSCITDLEKKGDIFFYASLAAESFMKQIEKEEYYSSERAFPEKDTKGEKESKKYKINADIQYKKNVMSLKIHPLIPILYAIFKVLSEKELIEGKKRYKYTHRDSKLSRNKEYAHKRTHGTTNESLLNFYVHGAKGKDKNVRSVDFIYANRKYLISKLAEIIRLTNETAEKLAYPATKKMTFYKFSDYFQQVKW